VALAFVGLMCLLANDVTDSPGEDVSSPISPRARWAANAANLAAIGMLVAEGCGAVVPGRPELASVLARGARELFAEAFEGSLPSGCAGTVSLADALGRLGERVAAAAAVRRSHDTGPVSARG
jgi:hypothetical protein